MGVKVPLQDTPLSAEDMALCLWYGHYRAFGEFPSFKRLGVAWAQCALENGHGTKIRNNNFGNVIATSSWPGNWWELLCHERPYPDERPNYWVETLMRFRALPDPETGAWHYWRTLALPRHVGALVQFDKGNPGAAAMALGASHYYTAHAEAYAKIMRRLYTEWLSVVQSKLGLTELAEERDFWSFYEAAKGQWDNDGAHY